MANPQKENGFAPIANEILEAVSKCKLNGTQFRILTIVWRYTYGFSRKEHELSVNFLAEATGITKRQIQKELNNLIEDLVLVEVRKASFNTTRIIGFNKNYDSWKCYNLSPKEQQVNKECRGERLDTSPGERLDTSPGERLDTQERKVLKKDLKKDTTTTEIVENPVVYFEQVLCRLSEIQMNKLYAWVDDFDGKAEIVNEAIKVADDKNKRYFGFVEYLLKEWHNSNLNSVERIRVYELEKFNKQKQPRSGYANQKQPRKELVPEWFEEKEVKPKEFTDEEKEKAEALKARLAKYKKEEVVNGG